MDKQRLPTELEVIMASLKSGAKPMFDNFTYSTPRTVFTALQAQSLNIPFYSDSYFIINKLVAISTGAFTAQPLNTSTGRVMTDQAIQSANLFGTVQLPNILKDPIIIPPSSNVQFAVVDASNAGNTIQLSLLGYRWYNLAQQPRLSPPGLLPSFYQYSLALSVAQNSIGNGIIRVDADADFLTRKLVGTQTGAYTIQITDSNSSENWFDQNQSNANAVGTAQYPNRMIKPRVVRKNSTLQISVQNLFAGTNAIQVVLEGAKVYVG